MDAQTRRYVALGSAGVGVLGGLIVLGTALSWWLPAGLVIFGVIATVRKLARAALALLCAAVVAMLVLVAFNVLLGIAIEMAPDRWVRPTDRLPIWIGLVLAVAIFAWASYYYMRATWLLPDRRTAEERRRKLPRAPEERETHVLAPARERLAASAWAVGLACVVILGVPPVAAWLTDLGKPPPAPLPAPERIGSRLDVVIVADRVRGDTAIDGGPTPAATAADVSFSVGQGTGRRVLWTQTGVEDPAAASSALSAPGSKDVDPPELRNRADAVIVLLVHPARKCASQLERWMAIARSAQDDVGAAIPVVSLLDTANSAAIACWSRSKELSFEKLGSRTVTDAAVALGLPASRSQPYLGVAFDFRPILLFDSDEPVPRPLSIEQMFEVERIRQCPDVGARGTCEMDPVAAPEDLVSPGNHLFLDRLRTDLKARAQSELEAWRKGDASVSAEADGPVGYGSRMYVNPVPVTVDDRQLLYLDYWWYLPDNPAGSGKRAFCGAGLVILGVTCFDHESDWEGVTVVLKRAAGGWEPIDMHFAQHESVVRYPWPQLRGYWDSYLDSDPPLTEQLAPDRADRPLVFVASGTHASYAHRCGGDCEQVATSLEEGHHAGRLPWAGDSDEICVTVTCLALLPTASGGRGAASWNAFAGPWGQRHCVLKYYCDSGTPPPAPGQQDRYADPAHYDGTADVTADDGGYVPRAQ